MNIAIDVPESFLNEEERCEYLVSSKMKRAWAVQLDLLAVLQRICKENNLTYFADSGTLIGAIRHKGYIPWDDDIDIVMLRDDYDKFVKIASSVLEYPYFIQNCHTEVFPRGYSRLRNCDSTTITKRDYGRGINLGIFIDIFPLDNLPDNKIVRAIWIKRLRFLYATVLYGTYGKARKQTDSNRQLKESIYGIAFKLLSGSSYDKLMDRFESLSKKYNHVDTEYLSYVAYSFAKKKHLWHRQCFESNRTVPYEFMDITIPEGYDERLRVEYGDYMQIVHAITAHGDTIIEPDIPYLEFLEQHTDEQIEELLMK